MNTTTFNYESFNHSSQPIVIAYHFGAQLDFDVLEQFKRDILQEAEIRLFSCSMKVIN